MDAAKDVGGDFYDFFALDDENIGFLIADVCGKGIPAALFMAVSRTLIRATAIRGINPQECISYSNNLLAVDSVDSMFVTVFYGIYNIKTGVIKYCNAGHNPPYILKSNGEAVELPMSEDLAVGVFDGVDFHDNQVQLEKGDSIVMFTDGVTEAMNVESEEFGNERLEKALGGEAGQSCQHIIDTVKTELKTFVGEADQSDDITMLVLKRL